MRARWLALALTCTTPAILACSGIDDLAEMAEPVPPPEDMSRLVGTWKGDGVELTLSADGMLHHQTQGAGSTEFTAPVKEWRDDAIVAGVGPVTQTFEIEGPRKAGKGKFVLVVNGNELVRQ